MAHQCAAPAGCCVFILYGRAGVHARRKTSCTARSRFARCLSRIVGAACMRPVKRCTHHPFTVCMVFASHGRAGDFARRTDDFSNFKNNNVRRGQDPALQIVVYGRFPRNPRAMAHPCREAYMPPLQIPGTASMTPGTGGGGRFTGRMHAAPTNRPGTAGKWQNRCLPQTSAAGVNARPTERRIRSYSPQITCPPATTFLARDRVWSMRRGGIHAARRNDALPGRLWFARCLSHIVGRGLGPAAPMIF